MRRSVHRTRHASYCGSTASRSEAVGEVAAGVLVARCVTGDDRQQARARSPGCDGERFATEAAQCDAQHQTTTHRSISEHYEVVAGALEIIQKVRGEHDGQTTIGGGGHERLKESAPCERIEAGDGLVEEEHFRTFGERQRESELGRVGRPTIRRRAVCDRCPRSRGTA